MLGRTHALLGVSALWLLAPLPGALTPETIGPLALAAAFGSLLPDLDAPLSLLSTWRVGGVQPLVPVSKLLHAALGHRGVLHSLLAWLGLGLFLGLTFGLLCLVFGLRTPAEAGVGQFTGIGSLPAQSPGLWAEIALALWLGYGSHLLGDALTPHGIPLLFPRRRRWHLLPPPLRIVTGSPAEDVLLALLTGGVLFLLLPALVG